MDVLAMALAAVGGGAFGYVLGMVRGREDGYRLGMALAERGGHVPPRPILSGVADMRPKTPIAWRAHSRGPRWINPEQVSCVRRTLRRANGCSACGGALAQVHMSNGFSPFRCVRCGERGCSFSSSRHGGIGTPLETAVAVGPGYFPLLKKEH